jgi:replicative DNA helicase
MAGEENTFKRILPHSEEAEMSVIGSMLMDNQAVNMAAEIISGEDFYNRNYGLYFDIMVDLNESGVPIDPVVVQDKLKEKNVPPEYCSVQFIQNIINSVPTSANIKTYADIVQEKSTLRKIIRANEEIASRCYRDEEDLEVILNDTEKSIFDLVQNRNVGDTVPIKKVVSNALAKIESAYYNKGVVTGVATGFIDLDYKTAGMQPSDLILIAARPSMGKTAFVLNIAQHMAIKNMKHVAIFSLEMSKEQLINRMFSLQSAVDAQKLRTGRLTMDDWNRLTDSANEIGKSNLIIDDTPSISIAQLRSKCRKFKLTQGLDCIIIDYLQLMSGSGKFSDSKNQEVSEISRSLKAIARELQVPVIALSQLSRAVEKRDDKRPMLSDLRESGAIEQDADVVMFIYREFYYTKDTEKENTAEIIIAKQRNGPVGTVELAWLPELTRFANLEHKKKDED